MSEQLLTTKEAARRLGVESQTLRVWRLRGYGPRFVRLGAHRLSRCMYDPRDVDAWLESRKRSSTSEELVPHSPASAA